MSARRNGRARNGAQAKRRRARIAKRLARGHVPLGFEEVAVGRDGTIWSPSGPVTAPLDCPTCELRRTVAVAAGADRFALCIFSGGELRHLSRFPGRGARHRYGPITRRVRWNARTDFSRPRPHPFWARSTWLTKGPFIHPNPLAGFRSILAGIRREQQDVEDYDRLIADEVQRRADVIERSMPPASALDRKRRFDDL